MSQTKNTLLLRQLRSRTAVELVSNASTKSTSDTATTYPLKTINSPSTIDESLNRLPKPTPSPTIDTTNFVPNDGTKCIPSFTTSVPQRSHQFELSSSTPEWALNFQSQFRDIYQRLSQFDSRHCGGSGGGKCSLYSTSPASTAPPPPPNQVSSRSNDAPPPIFQLKHRRKPSKKPASSRLPTPVAIAALQQKKCSQNLESMIPGY
ncbi:hypothetical protein MAM1_0012d01218 [Mucor ambiguus]|uniref:Uncharacterized protein n=1 Tax=Mucor ambiguus TaxID=91626 RepID=A0A0C9MIQ8_9FUNG|nr:hypothetical protein MAM1_0012d01218 [Mucor ambiguus]